MKLLLTGSSGLLGTAITRCFSGEGMEVAGLSRSGKKGEEENIFQWDPEGREIDPGALKEVDAVVHLAGENVIEGRWNEEKKKRILESRRTPTRFLAETLAGMETPPKVLISASGINYYGDRGDEDLLEDSGPGESFISEVCCEWEAATAPAEEAGIRVVHGRFAPVLTKKGGLLGKVLPPFKSGVGGRLGSGKQYMGWIHVEDFLGFIRHCLTNGEFSGPVNVSSPAPVRNSDFTRILARVLHRPAIFPVPGAVLRTIYGEMADNMLLASTKVIPGKLQESGFEFKYPELEAALKHLLEPSS